MRVNSSAIMKWLVVFLLWAVMLIGFSACENSNKTNSQGGMTSAEISTAFETYPVFEQLEVGTSYSEATKILTDAGMVEQKSLSSKGLPGVEYSEYSFADEDDQVYIELDKKNDLLYSKYYHLLLSNSFDSGFMPTEAVYQDLYDQITAGTITTLADIEAVIGNAYLFSVQPQSADDPSLIYINSWRGDLARFDAFTDENGKLISYKIGYTGTLSN
ncbi:MAG: hypothetical protein PWP16_579 [Eubacteriaceae bacterium]|nr:hypothetical protein [Eubacteriaceae bacterium]MDK2936686.1 hypothetical protein [Eubacteriaceae bacterium]MDK2961138.1 hypothetical protein [Eubacteriaceae bacterium]MDN5307216.1 hypothetical protein [Eubacteriaceae bacterium]